MPQPHTAHSCMGYGTDQGVISNPASVISATSSRAKRASTQSALDPLPGLGDDILVEPLARRVIQRSDRDDSPVVGYLEVAHIRGPSRLNASTPRSRQARGLSGCR